MRLDRGGWVSVADGITEDGERGCGIWSRIKTGVTGVARVAVSINSLKIKSYFSVTPCAAVAYTGCNKGHRCNSCG